MADRPTTPPSAEAGETAAGTIAAPAAPMTAGARLRQAREAQGLHIAALAAALKVSPRKLEALERDRHEELPDATFTRALAQTVCRALKIDAAPVLALLPKADGARLDQVDAGLNAPFRERNAGTELPLTGLVRHPAFAIVALLVVGALAFWFWPRGTAVQPAVDPAASAPAQIPGVNVAPSAASAAAPMPGEGASGVAPGVPSGAASGVGTGLQPAGAPGAVPGTLAGTPGAAPAMAAPVVLGETVHSAPPVGVAGPSGAATPGAPASPGLLVVRTREASWVEVVDAAQRPLLSRTVVPGESVAVDGTPPLRLTVGNAAATTLAFRGRPVDLAPVTRDNVARLELQ
jgi:cytoskeleton protein RodZ